MDALRPNQPVTLLSCESGEGEKPVRECGGGARSWLRGERGERERMDALRPNQPVTLLSCESGEGEKPVRECGGGARSWLRGERETRWCGWGFLRYDQTEPRRGRTT